MAVSDPVRPAAQMKEVEAIGEIAGESRDGDGGEGWEEVRGGLQHMYYSALPGCAWWMITSVARQSLALEVHCLRKCGGGYRHTPLLRSKQHSSSVSPPECPAADASAGRDPIGEVRTPTPRQSGLHALPDAYTMPTPSGWLTHGRPPGVGGRARGRGGVCHADTWVSRP